MRFYNVEQNTPEWENLRIAKITSSKLGVVMANYGNPFGDPAKSYATSIAVEQITGKKSGESYTNAHTERGHEQEPLARMLYEDEYFCEVTNGGFFDLGDIGCSPDGLIGDDGLIEIKSVIANVHYKNIKRQDIDPAYKWQIYGNLKFSERQYIDFISYCQEFPEGKKLFVRRVQKKDCYEQFKKIDIRIGEFRKLIAESKNTILNTGYSIL